MLKNRLAAGVDRLINLAGTRVRVTNFTSTIGSVWDDDVSLTVNTETWTSGIQLPINDIRGSDDSLLVEQGKLIDGDIKMFMHGSIIITGSELCARVGIGSPIHAEYGIIADGINTARVSDQSIYRKIYLRQLTGPGSLFGE